MFKLFIYCLLLLLFSSCNSSIDHEVNTINRQNTLENRKSIYVNEYGKLEVTFENDALAHVVFSNNTEETWDTTFHKVYNSTIFDDTSTEGFEIFKIKYSIVLISPEKIRVNEISSFAFLQSKTKIKNLYKRPFYKTRQKITLRNTVQKSKKDHLIEGLYIKSNQSYPRDTQTITGIVKKAPYPLSYYTTNDSPQGMFGDTSKQHFKLNLVVKK